jgi:hypothetical protein
MMPPTSGGGLNECGVGFVEFRFDLTSATCGRFPLSVNGEGDNGGEVVFVVGFLQSMRASFYHPPSLGLAAPLGSPV